MPATTDVPDATDHRRPINKKSAVGDWEIHSWGHGAFPGMAILSAITTLQVGATLATDLADKIALNQAADSLKNTLTPQLKSFQRILSAR
jgi:hypothetical protein